MPMAGARDNSECENILVARNTLFLINEDSDPVDRDNSSEARVKGDKARAIPMSSLTGGLGDNTGEYGSGILLIQ